MRVQEEATTKVQEEAAAKGGADASASSARETDSPPPSPPREGRTKWVHDPARPAEADARAGGADASSMAGQETMDPLKPAADQTALPDVPPAADQDREASQNAGAEQGSDETAADGETQQPGMDAIAGSAGGAGGWPRQPDVGVEPENSGTFAFRWQAPAPLSAPLSQGRQPAMLVLALRPGCSGSGRTRARPPAEWL